MSNDEAKKKSMPKKTEATVRTEHPPAGPASGLKTEELFLKALEQDLNEDMLRALDKTEERWVGKQADARTIEREVAAPSHAKAAPSKALTKSSADLLSITTRLTLPERPQDPEYMQLRNITQQLVMELGKQVDYVERLSTIAVNKSYKEGRERKSKRRYFKALLVTVCILLGCVIFFKYALTEEQKKAFRAQLEKAHLLTKVEEAEKTIIQTQLEVSEKNKQIQEKDQHLKVAQENLGEKEKELQVVEKKVGEKEHQLSQTKAVLSKTQLELQLKSYINSQLQRLKDFSRETEKSLANARDIYQKLQESQHLVQPQYYAMNQLLDQFLETKTILGKFTPSGEEALLLLQASLQNLAEEHALFINKSRTACERAENVFTTFAGLLKRRQAEFLQYAEAKDAGEVEKRIAQEMSGIEAMYRNEQSQNRAALTGLQTRLADFQSEQWPGYLKMAEYYQRHSINNSSFSQIYQHLQDLLPLVQEVKEACAKAEPGLPKDWQARSKELAEKQKESATWQPGLSANYWEFIQALTAKTLMETVPHVSIENEASGSKLAMLSQQISDKDKQIAAIMDRVNEIYQTMQKHSKYYLDAKELLAKELARPKPTVPASVEHKPAPALRTETRDISADKAKFLQIYDNIRSCFKMSGCEFVATTKMLGKQRDKFILQNYVIAKVLAENPLQTQPGAIFFQALAPQEFLGNRILKRGLVSWFYEERNNTVSRLTPQLLRLGPSHLFQQMVDTIDLTSLLGQNYELHHEFEQITTDTHEAQYRFRLQAPGNQEIPSIYCLYSVAHDVPVKLEYCNQANTPTMLVYCRAFQTTPLGKRITKYVVVDKQNPDLLLEIEYLNVVKKEFPQYVFQKENISQLK